MTLKSSKIAFGTGLLFPYHAGGKFGDKVRPYFNEVLEGRSTGLISEVTLAEYFYKTCQKLGKEAAETRLAIIRSEKYQIVEVDQSHSAFAGLLKCKYADISLADALAASLAKNADAFLLTSDEGLSDVCKKEGIKVRLVRAD